MAKLTLIVTKDVFEQICSGEKKEDYRSPSAFNSRLLGVKAADGLYDPRKDIESIFFAVGYKKDRETVEVKCSGIRAEHREADGQRQTRIVISLGEILNICLTKKEGNGKNG